MTLDHPAKAELLAIIDQITKSSAELNFATETRAQTIARVGLDMRECRKQAEIIRLISHTLRENLRSLEDWLYKTEEQSDNY